MRKFNFKDLKPDLENQIIKDTTRYWSETLNNILKGFETKG